MKRLALWTVRLAIVFAISWAGASGIRGLATSWTVTRLAETEVYDGNAAFEDYWARETSGAGRSLAYVAIACVIVVMAAAVAAVLHGARRSAFRSLLYDDAFLRTVLISLVTVHASAILAGGSHALQIHVGSALLVAAITIGLWVPIRGPVASRAVRWAPAVVFMVTAEAMTLLLMTTHGAIRHWGSPLVVAMAAAVTVILSAAPEYVPVENSAAMSSAPSPAPGRTPRHSPAHPP